jgi:C-terminal processing protease CtpA/Prc
LFRFRRPDIFRPLENSAYRSLERLEELEMKFAIQSFCLLLLATFPCLAADQPNSAAPAEIFERLCTALRDNYPMLEYAGWNDAWVREYRAKIAAAPTRQEAFELMDELVCRLNDYHTRFNWPERPRLVSPPLRVEPVFTSGDVLLDHARWQARPTVDLPALDGVAIAIVEADQGSGLRAGDEIVSVEGFPVRDVLARAWRHSACSSAAGKLRAAAGRMLQGPPDSPLRLEVRRAADQGGRQVIPVTVARGQASNEKTVSSREVDGVPVIRIARWFDQLGQNLTSQFDKLLDEFRSRPGFIIDVRGNGGGEDSLASKVIGRFIKAPVISSISFHREVPGVTFKRTVDTTDPRGPWRYEGRVAVLIDEGCLSACEHFVSGMSEGGALLCGTPTSGACGWIRPVDLPGGAKVFVSQTFPLHTGGLPSPLLGIAPHLWAPRTLADLRTGHDTALQAALLWIKSGKPVPAARLQPLSTFSESSQ